AYRQDRGQRGRPTAPWACADEHGSGACRPLWTSPGRGRRPPSGRPSRRWSGRDGVADVRGTRGAGQLGPDGPGGVDRPGERSTGGVFPWLTNHRDALFFGVTVGLLAAGGVAFVLAARSVATGLWIAATILG